MKWIDQVAQDARLYILMEIDAQVDDRLNVLLVQRLLDSKYGINRDRDWVETQMRRLSELGAVELLETAVMTARLCRPGRDHLAMRSEISGITRPSEIE